MPATPDQIAESAKPEGLRSRGLTLSKIGERPYWRSWTRTFDVVLSIDFGGSNKPELAQLQRITIGSFFTIDRVVRK